MPGAVHTTFLPAQDDISHPDSERELVPRVSFGVEAGELGDELIGHFVERFLRIYAVWRFAHGIRIAFEHCCTAPRSQAVGPLDSPRATNRRHIWLADLPTQHAVRRDFGRRRGRLHCTTVLIAELQLGCAEQVLKLVKSARPDNRRGNPGYAEQPRERDLRDRPIVPGRNGGGGINDLEITLDGSAGCRLLQVVASEW